ncbi:MAG: class I SAM-dependent methyltransferase, partial [Planctomycetota bacterium]
LLPTRREAVDFPTGEIALAHCRACGFLFNAAFDPSRLEYSARYEETQGYSPTFRSWHEKLARDLIERYGLRRKKVVEIGCGKGEFLTLLCELGENEGTGFDPAYVPERNQSPARERVRFIRDFYSERYGDEQGDFLCCKMTLEHIQPAADFIRTVRRSLGEGGKTLVLFQVPDVERILEEIAFWDVYYEHCSYYSLGSLARLFRRSGFHVRGLAREFDGQYLMIEALPGNGTPSPPVPGEDDAARIGELVARFARLLPGRLTAWRKRLAEFRSHDRRMVVWGSGSKGVSFLTTLGIREEVEFVVDINPHRQGNFMAGTGQEIVAPGFLQEYRPDVVVIMNPVYREEIAAELRRQDLRPEILTP